ncbi:MAG: hypothetical protein M3Z05_17155, partial [Gemmatimonadota bacterium]|nr:hypothetical protein [Gemmatimonadota bacterium]
MPIIRPSIYVVAIAIGATACQAKTDAPGATSSVATVPAEAIAAMDTGTIMQHIRVLAADSLMGRQPGTPGEDKSVA